MQLYKLIKDDITTQPLVQVAIWCLGEFGGDIVGKPLKLDIDSEVVTEEDIVNIVEKVLNYNAGSLVTREYAINAIMKLSVHLKSQSE